jgi:hypothetical protein
MNAAKTSPQSTASNVIIGLAFTFGGVVWLALILFFTTDAIGDFREAHSPESGVAPPWMWRDSLQHLGGVGGVLVGFTPPSILFGYGLYLLFSSASRKGRRDPLLRCQPE